MKKATLFLTFLVCSMIGFTIALLSTNISAHSEAKKFLILEYHDISSNTQNESNVPPKAFLEQMLYLKNEGFTPINFSQYDAISMIKNPVLVTFDNVTAEFYNNAYPILAKSNIKGTAFIFPRSIGTPTGLSLDQIKKMKFLIDFEAHSVSNIDLRTLDTQKLEDDLFDSKILLQKLLEKDVSVFSYPKNMYDKRIVNSVKKYYKLGVASTSREFIDESHLILRTRIDSNVEIEDFKKLFSM